MDGVCPTCGEVHGVVGFASFTFYPWHTATDDEVAEASASQVVMEEHWTENGERCTGSGLAPAIRS